MGDETSFHRRDTPIDVVLIEAAQNIDDSLIYPFNELLIIIIITSAVIELPCRR